MVPPAFGALLLHGGKLAATGFLTKQVTLII
ncbi:hypothetical protein BH23GEM6_BH23GEM6_10930 [soil metagenome]